jgi:hypothetical protein
VAATAGPLRIPPARRSAGPRKSGSSARRKPTYARTNPAIRAALATKDKEYVEIEGATHYYVGQPKQLAECIATVTDWSQRKKLLA